MTVVFLLHVGNTFSTTGSAALMAQTDESVPESIVTLYDWIAEPLFSMFNETLAEWPG